MAREAYMIDMPTPFASLDAWRQFRDELRDLPQDDPEVKRALEAARKAIAKLEAEAAA